jgi:16S rRNA processing protein RimM
VRDFFLIAKIDSVYGKNGFVKISSYSDFPDRFFELNEVFVDFFDEKKKLIVEKVVKQKDFFTIKFKNFNTAEDVSVLKTKEIFVDSNGLIKLPTGYFFIHDMVQSKVFRNEKEFGILKDVLKFPANDVYLIEDNEGKEILIPAVKDFIENFDAEKKILTLKPGDDFYEDDED